MLYITISVIQKKEVEGKNSFLRKIFSYLVPKANPDYDHLIKLVSSWVLEFEDKNSTPNREIGLDSKGDVLMKMPYNNNYGYWCDNNLTYNEFKEDFSSQITSREVFEQKWNQFPLSR